MHIHMHIHIYTYTHIHTYIHTYVRTALTARTYIHTHTYANTHCPGVDAGWVSSMFRAWSSAIQTSSSSTASTMPLSWEAWRHVDIYAPRYFKCCTNQKTYPASYARFYLSTYLSINLSLCLSHFNLSLYLACMCRAREREREGDRGKDRKTERPWVLFHWSHLARPSAFSPPWRSEDGGVSSRTAAVVSKSQLSSIWPASTCLSWIEKHLPCGLA